MTKLVKHILVHMDMETYKMLVEAKGNRKWREMLEMAARELKK